MKLVVDANVVMSALIADSRTRELLVTLESTLVTPEIVHDEIQDHEDLVAEKSEMESDRIQQFTDLLFDHVETIPARKFYQEIDRAEAAIGETDPDDVLYLACALGCAEGIWSDDTDFRELDLVPTFTTDEIVRTFDTVEALSVSNLWIRARTELAEQPHPFTTRPTQPPVEHAWTNERPSGCSATPSPTQATTRRSWTGRS